MAWIGNSVDMVKESWNGEICEDTYSESGLLDLTAMKFQNPNGSTMYGVFVNDALAYQSPKSHQVSRLYEELKRN